LRYWGLSTKIILIVPPCTILCSVMWYHLVYHLIWFWEGVTIRDTAGGKKGRSTKHYFKVGYHSLHLNNLTTLPMAPRYRPNFLLFIIHLLAMAPRYRPNFLQWTTQLLSMALRYHQTIGTEIPPQCMISVLGLRFGSGFEVMTIRDTAWKEGSTKHYFKVGFILICFWKLYFSLQNERWISSAH